MMPIISVIMPAYNAEKTIRRALEHLRGQTFTNFEVIIVNDGSTDNTTSIIKEFEDADKRFKQFFQTNNGVAAARNLGVEIASGQYMIHHDADDEMPDNALEILYRQAKSSGAGLVIGDFITSHGNINKYTKQEASLQWDHFIQGLLDNKVHGGLWNKLIDASLCKKTKFMSEINYMEDKIFLIKLLVTFHPQISYINKPVYYYIQQANSITNNRIKKNILILKDIIEEIEVILAGTTSSFDLSKIKFQYKLSAALYNLDIDFKNDFKEVNSRILFLRGIPLRYKIVLLSKVFGWGFISLLYIKIKKIMGKSFTIA